MDSMVIIYLLYIFWEILKIGEKIFKEEDSRNVKNLMIFTEGDNYARLEKVSVVEERHA